MIRRQTRIALTDSRSKWSRSDSYVVPFEGLVRSFLRRLKAEGKAETTLARYELVLRQFEQASGASAYPWPPTGEHLSDYLARERDAGKAKNTVRNSYVALRAFFNWAVDEGEVSAHPMVRLKTPPLDLASPEGYTDDDVRAMLRFCRGRYWTDARDAALIAVRADTGLRASEFCQLTIEDIELDAERLRIIGKGGRQRFVRLESAAQVYVDRYLRRRPRVPGLLWIGRTRQPMTISGVYQVVERICRAAGVDRPGVHRFRHYAASAMLRRGMGELDLSKFMGWSTLAMAQRYTQHEAQERALIAHKEHSPLDGLN